MMKFFSKIMTILKINIVDLPSPKNLTYFWNFGSFLGIIMVVQIFTGILLTFLFTPDSSIAFLSVEYLMRMVNMGYLVRWIHLNLASFFFLMIYIHMFRGIYFNSYMFKDTWNTGVTLLIMLMAIAFMGYVLPWGQMSFWAATVITKFFTVIPLIGVKMVIWIWSGFSVNNLTLKFFFSLHFLLPMVLIIVVIFHLISLHFFGSSSPLFHFSSVKKMKFTPVFISKDMINILVFMLILAMFSMWSTSEPENFLKADYVSSPAHIKPEWYFLFAYAILRSIPQKLLGVVMMFLALIVLYLFSFLNLFLLMSNFKNLNKLYFWLFVTNFIMLSWVGGNPVTDLFVFMGLFGSTLYFLILLFILFSNYLINLMLK